MNRTDASRRSVSAGLAALVLLAAAPAPADEAANLKVALPVLLKVLTYDQNFDSRGYGEFVVLVASDAAQLPARDRLMEGLKAVSVNAIKNRPIKFVGVEVVDEPTLDADVQRTKGSAILAVAGISDAALVAISNVAQDNQIYSLSLDAAAVQKSMAVGVVQNGGRPQIIINERASRSLGVKFETSVLKLAKLVQ